MDFQNFKNRLEYSKDNRKKQEVMWYINQTFIESNTYWTVDFNNNRLLKTKPTWVDRKVNLSRPLLRNIITNITRNNPRWNISKAHIKNFDNIEEERRVANALLDNVWDNNDCKLILKDVIRDSAIKWIWFWEIYYEPVEDEMKINYIDTFDLYIDPSARLDWWTIDWRYIIKAVSIPLENVINTEAYNDYKFMLKTENKSAESDQKERIIQSNNWWVTEDDKLWNVILYEIFYKQDNTVYKQVFCQKYLLTEPEDLWIKDFPIIGYQMERMQGRLYPVAWTDPVVEMNKSVNRIVSSLETYVHTIAKGRYLKRRSERISTISDKHWQFVNYDNVAPVPMNVPNIWPTPFEMMNNFERWVSDSWGSYSLSSDRAQAVQTRSWTWVAQLQQQDMESVSEPLDNLKIFLKNSGEIILDIASKRYKHLKTLYWKDTIIQTVWEQAQDKIKKYKNISKIKPFKWLEIDIIPGWMFTEMQNRQDLIELKKMWIDVPDKYILQTFKMWDTDSMIEDLEAQALRKENPDIKIAEWENQKMLQGQQIHANITDDHKIHLALHSKFLETAKWDPTVSQLVIAHIREHEMIEKGWNPNNPQLENQPQQPQQPQ